MTRLQLRENANNFKGVEWINLDLDKLQALANTKVDFGLKEIQILKGYSEFVLLQYDSPGMTAVKQFVSFQEMQKM